jgi:hypothetical protein
LEYYSLVLYAIYPKTTTYQYYRVIDALASVDLATTVLVAIKNNRDDSQLAFIL